MLPHRSFKTYCMNKQKCFLILLASFMALPGYLLSQTKDVSGIITDAASKQPLQKAIVQLLRASDSIVVKAALSDSAGRFSLAAPGDATYLVKCSHVNYANYLSAPIRLTSEQAPPLQIGLTVASTELSGVTVTSRRSAISFQGDKMVVNPANMAGTTTSHALDLLKSMPGITVENEERITLNGSSDVTVLIDDRKRTMTLDQAVRLLKTIPATNIKQVEISIGKSARQDASGNAGVINIVTKKPLGNGYNLQLSNQFVINDYVGNAHNLYLNYKHNAFSIYASAGYTKSYSYTRSNSHSIYQLAGSKSQVLDNGRTKSVTSAPYFDLGIDYEIDKKQVIGVTGSIYTGKTSYGSALTTSIDNPKQYTVTNINDQQTPESLNSIDLLYSIKLDNKGSKLRTDAGYLWGDSRPQPYFTNLYADKNGQGIATATHIKAYLPMRGHQYIFQADLDQYFKDKSLLQAGAKYTRGLVDNTARYDTIRGNSLINDPRRNDDLGYEEGIAALYLSYRRNLSRKWSFVAGIRYENTYMKNTSRIADSTFSRNVDGFFPSASLTYNGKKIKTTLNYNRSITRPYYGYLNPYTTYIDEFTLQEGNSLLKPGYTNSVSLTNVYNSFLYVTVGYSRATDLLFLMKRQIPDTTLTIIKPENALNYNSAFASISGYYQFFKRKWEGQLRLYGFIFRNKVDPKFTTSALDSRTLGRFTVSTSQTIKIAKDLTLENALYYYGRNRSNQVEMGSRYQLDLGVNKKFLGGALTASAYASDILNSMDQERFRYYDGYQSTSHVYYSIRQLRLSLIFNLGKLDKDFQKSTSTKKEASRFKEGQ